MSPAKHAMLSASSAHRWLNCTPSARLEQEFKDRQTEAAAEGTAAHALAEYKLRRALHQQAKRPVSRYANSEMDEYTEDYAQFVQEAIAEAKRYCADPVVHIEQRLDFSDYVPDGFGTGDCVIVADRRLHIIDFKYGQGVLVEAEHNPQMMLYALGALHVYDALYDVDEVSMTIYQPRRANVSTWTISVDELKAWAENELRPRARLAYAGEGEYCPGAWCMFCRAAVKCRARAEDKLRLAQYEFAQPPVLTDGEIAGILGKLDDLVHWATDIREYALNAALSGVHFDGWKVVEGRANRRYTDEAAAAQAVIATGHDPYEHRLLGISAMEKLLGRKKFSEVLGELVERPQGKPTLVPASDKRPELSGVDSEFNAIQEEV